MRKWCRVTLDWEGENPGRSSNGDVTGVGTLLAPDKCPAASPLALLSLVMAVL